MKILKVDTLMQLLSVIKTENSKNEYWFRGQPDADYNLMPSAYRKLYTIADQFGRPVKPELVTSYSLRGEQVFLPDHIYLKKFLEELDKHNIHYDKNIIDQFCLAQHYGVKTPMLDWSTDALVALFFAVHNRKINKECALFLLNPVKFNDQMIFIKKVLSSEEATKLCKFTPVAIYGKKIDKRMCRQSGNFTVHGVNIWPLDIYKLPDDIIIKIIISDKLANELNEYLTCMGITEDSIYVEKDIKDSISKQIDKINEINVKKVLTEKYNKWKQTPKHERGFEIRR